MSPLFVLLQGDSINRGDKPDQMGGFLGAADLGTNVTPIDLVTGRDYVCALTSAGAVKWCDLRCCFVLLLFSLVSERTSDRALVYVRATAVHL